MMESTKRKRRRKLERTVLEVCVDSVESAIAAIEGGAGRLEVCSNLHIGGGTTPSIGLIRAIHAACPDIKEGALEVVALVRPRIGDFLYSDLETSVMLEDISSFAAVGITGVAIGALTRDGRLDVGKVRALADRAVALGLEVSLHRAFDMVEDQIAEMEVVLSELPSVKRILTSGGKPKAIDALHELTVLQTAAGYTGQLEVEIMPGSGVNAENVTEIVTALHPQGPCAIHMSGGGLISDAIAGVGGEGMRYRKEGMGMGEWVVWRTDAGKVRAVREAIDDAHALILTQPRHLENLLVDEEKDGDESSEDRE